LDGFLSDLDVGRSLGKNPDEGVTYGRREFLAGGFGCNGRFGGALSDLLFGGGNGATLGAFSPMRRDWFDELVPGRTNAGFGRKGVY